MSQEAAACFHAVLGFLCGRCRVAGECHRLGGLHVDDLVSFATQGCRKTRRIPTFTLRLISFPSREGSAECNLIDTAWIRLIESGCQSVTFAPTESVTKHKQTSVCLLKSYL